MSSKPLEKHLNENLDLIDGTGLERYSSVIRRNRDFILENSDYLQDDSVTHGDTHMPNILSDRKGNIKTIIDWEYSCKRSIEYDIAKAEARIFDLYGMYTEKDSSYYNKIFREQYNLCSKQEQLVEAHKAIYSIRTLAKMRRRGSFEYWDNYDLEKCSYAYERIVENNTLE